MTLAAEPIGKTMDDVPVQPSMPMVSVPSTPDATQMDSAGAPGLCRKKLRGAECGVPVAQGKYCPDHVCGRSGCGKPKGKRAVFCKNHTAAAENAGTTPLYVALHARVPQNRHPGVQA